VKIILLLNFRKKKTGKKKWNKHKNLTHTMDKKYKAKMKKIKKGSLRPNKVVKRTNKRRRK